MKQKDIEILIQKYLNGETTPEEERELALEVSRDDAPQEWKIIAEMLGELTIDEALYDKMMAERKHVPRIIKFWPWLAAACVAALLIVFLAPPEVTQPQKGEPQIAHAVKDSVMLDKPETIDQQQSIANADRKTDSTPVAKPKGKAVKKATITTNQIAKAETTEESTPLAETTPEAPQATEDLFDATLANVRRAALQKMMSCNMQCMNEDINLRANHLSTLIQEQNQ